MAYIKGASYKLFKLAFWHFFQNALGYLENHHKHFRVVLLVYIKLG